MRIGNLDGRLKLLVGDGAVDVERASDHRFGHDPSRIYRDFDEFREWAGSIGAPTEPFEVEKAGPPVPSPSQVFAIGLNYPAHASESGFQAPTSPVVFTKYASSFSGPVSEIVLPAASTDWEVEVVAVISRPGKHVSVADAWSYVAGLTVGQDISERELQRSGPAPQYSLAKSFHGFSPMGPAVVTLDEIPDPGRLALGCSVNGTPMQGGNTAEMIFSIPEIVAYLSSIVTLHPGDLIFTGTPDGVGMGRRPPVYLKPGDELRSWVEGIGELRQRFVNAAAAAREDGVPAAAGADG
jgi:2-keto-4-pentenoate hydratase/2-oxohepta-3-ene-1,7-dioic acid hydratase in catechol pathway